MRHTRKRVQFSAILCYLSFLFNQLVDKESAETTEKLEGFFVREHLMQLLRESLQKMRIFSTDSANFYVCR